MELPGDEKLKSGLICLTNVPQQYGAESLGLSPPKYGVL